jgi:hypothetical protein
MSDSTMASYLAEHPRLMGVLFTLLVLLTQAGNVVASQSGTSLSGP